MWLEPLTVREAQILRRLSTLPARLFKGSCSIEVASALRGNPGNLQMHRLWTGSREVWGNYLMDFLHFPFRLLHSPASCCPTRSPAAPKCSLALLFPVRSGQWQKLARHGGHEERENGVLIPQLILLGPQDGQEYSPLPKAMVPLQAPSPQWPVLLGGNNSLTCSWRPRRVVLSPCCY